MSLFATVTFDLHGIAPPRTSAYSKVRRGFAKIGLNKQAIRRDTGKRVKLPANTYVGVFDGKWEKKGASDLRDHLRDEIEKVMKLYNYKATIFVSVGENWAWGKRPVRSNNSFKADGLRPRP